MSGDPPAPGPAPPTARSRGRALVARLALPVLAVGALYAVRPGVVENGLRSPRLWLLVVGLVLAARLLAGGVRRATGRPRAGAVASHALVAGAVVALLLPSFSQRELDEPLVPDAAPAAAPSSTSRTPTSRTPTPRTPTPRTPTSRTPTPRTPTPRTATARDAGAPRELSSARLDGVGHAASGRTRLVEVDGRLVLRFEDVDVEGTPGPHVHLVPAGQRSPDGGTSLGPLRAERGSFGYALPEDLDLDLERPWTVLVWCRPFATPVAASDHRPPDARP